MNLTTDPQLDGRMRPCYEYQAAIVSVLSTFVLSNAHSFAGIPYSTSYALATVSSVMCLNQIIKGRQLKKYHRSLKVMKHYAINVDDLPISNDYFWLGMGFEWTQVHAQRLYEARLPNGQKIIEPSRFYKYIRTLDEKIKSKTEKERSFFENQIIKTINRYKFAGFINNPLAPPPPIGGSSLLHGVGENEEKNIMPGMKSLDGHVLVLGTTGCGKTRAAELFITADIRRNIKKKYRVRNSAGDFETREKLVPDGLVAVLDPKGDADLLARTYSEAKKAGREFYFFHLGEPEITCRYNGIANFSRLSECATRISGQLSAAGDSSAFKEFAWRFIAIICNTLFEMKIRPTYEEIRRYITDMDALFMAYCKNWVQRNGIYNLQELMNSYKNEVANVPEQLKRKDLEMKLLYLVIRDQLKEKNEQPSAAFLGLINAVKYDATYFSKITASLLPLLEKLCAGDLINILSPDYSNVNDKRPVLDWTQAVRKNAVVYCGFAAMVDRDVATAVSNSMFSDLLSLSGKIYQSGINYGLDGASSKDKNNIYIHADEVNEMCGDEFIPILNKARGSGVRVTAYTQAIEDLEVRMGNKPKASVVQANFNTTIMFRVKSPSTAQVLIDQLSNVNIYDRNTMSGGSSNLPIEDGSNIELMTTRFSNGVSSVANEPLIKESDVISLPRGQAFALLEGSKLYKIRFPLLKECDAELTGEIKEVYRAMKIKYQSYENWWERAV